MVVSWAITEVIRYGHYTAGQLGLKPYVLLWLRYDGRKCAAGGLPGPSLIADICVSVRWRTTWGGHSYTLFFVLYPTGAGSEALLAYAALQTATGYFWTSLVIVLFLYIPCTSLCTRASPQAPCIPSDPRAAAVVVVRGPQSSRTSTSI